MSENQQKVCLGDETTRFVRNVTGSVVHVSSFHNLTEEQYGRLVIVASELTAMTDPRAILAEHIKDGGMTEYTPLGHAIKVTPFEQAMGRVLSKSIGGLGLDEKQTVFLSLTANQAAMIAMIVARHQGAAREELIEKTPFFLNHVEAEPKQFPNHSFRGVCGAPAIAREWIRAGAKALDLFESEIVNKHTTPPQV